MADKLIQSIRCASCLIILSGLLAMTGMGSEIDWNNPVAVISFAPAERLTEDFRYLTRITGRQQAATQWQRIGAPLLKHLKPDQPAGMLIAIHKGEPKGVGFLPVPNGNKLFAALESSLGIKAEDVGDELVKLEWGKGAYLKQQGDWLYVADHPRHLSPVPENPAGLLDGLDKQYDIALRLFVRNIPQGLKDVTDFTLRTRIDKTLQSGQGAAPELDKAFLGSVGSSMKKTVSTLINESDQVTLGWSLDSGKRLARLEVQAQAKAGSSLSRQLDSLMDNRSTFTGFFTDDAAMAFQGAIRVPQAGQTRIGATLDYLRAQVLQGIDADPAAPESLKHIVTSVLDVIQRTVEEGKTDGGATLVLAPQSFNFVGGLRVADGQALADAFERLFELAKNEPDVPEVNFYAKTYKKLDLHTLQLPVADDDKDARKLLGPHIDMTIATGPEQLFFALGPEGEDLLEAVIEQAERSGARKVPLVDLRVALKPVMNYLASLEKENKRQQALAKFLKRAPGGDTIRLKVQSVENGIGCRLEVEEGVLALLREASEKDDSE